MNKLRLGRSASKALGSYDWPGNVRELEHLLSRAALKAIREQGRASKIIDIEAGYLDLQGGDEIEGLAGPIETPPSIESGLNFNDSIDAFKRRLIEDELERKKNKLSDVARALGLDRSNLVRMMKRLGL